MALHGHGSKNNCAQARWIKEGICEVDARCRCIRYCSDEVGNCLDGGWGWWLKQGYNFLGFCNGHI